MQSTLRGRGVRFAAAATADPSNKRDSLSVASSATACTAATVTRASDCGATRDLTLDHVTPLAIEPKARHDGHELVTRAAAATPREGRPHPRDAIRVREG